MKLLKCCEVFLESAKCPIVLDADALNMLAEHTELQKMIPKNSILTPHPGEWARIMGRKSSSWIRVQEALTFAKDHQVIVLMKGAHSAICLPDGRTFFNSTGNPGMGTAGSGVCTHRYSHQPFWHRAIPLSIQL